MASSWEDKKGQQGEGRPSLGSKEKAGPPWAARRRRALPGLSLLAVLAVRFHWEELCHGTVAKEAGQSNLAIQHMTYYNLIITEKDNNRS